MSYTPNERLVAGGAISYVVEQGDGTFRAVALVKGKPRKRYFDRERAALTWWKKQVDQ